jgi:hypothetical protein
VLLLLHAAQELPADTYTAAPSSNRGCATRPEQGTSVNYIFLLLPFALLLLLPLHLLLLQLLAEIL